MKKLFYTSLLIALFVTLFTLTAVAETYGDLTYTVSNGKVTITDCKESATSVTIPEKINGYPLTQIAAYAFYGCTGLTSITIPDSVTNIGRVAFSHCTSLKSITFPDSVTYIGENAFYNCTSLEEVHITDIESWFNISFGDFYANPLFYACNGLYIDGKPITSVTIPVRGNRIRDYALYNCTSLETITIPDNFVAIGTYAFSGCTSLTSINIPDGVESIGDYAFENCTSLTSITIPDSVTYIGSSAFENCTSLTSITIPDSVTIVGSNAFRECTSLTSIAIPDSVTSIGFSAFHGCSALEEVTLPFVGNPKDGTSNTHFGYIFGASSYWSNDYYVPRSLKKVTITGGTSVCPYDFYNCTSLTSIIVLDSVTSIGSQAFRNCTSLTSITIPASVTSIDDYVFENCTSLIKVEFEQDSTLASIGYHAFAQCTSLTSIVIPDGVTNIGSSAFSGCTSLTSITIPQSVTSIGYYAFTYCSNLEEVHITDLAAWFDINFENSSSNPLYNSNAQLFVNGEEISADMVFSEGITQIPSYIFQNCKNLTSITIPNSITRIGVCAFANCTNLTSIVIPDSITSISSSAFSGCTSLTSIVIPDSVTSISDYAFYNCSSLTSITIPDSVTSIGYEAFYKCSSLEEITLPFVGASATATGYEGVFGYIFGYTTSSSSSTDNGATYQYSSGNTYYHYYIPSSIKKVTITGGTTISGNAFYNCTSLMSITISDSVTSIGSGAFRGCSGLEEITLPFIGNTKDGTTNTHFGYIFGASSYSYNDDYVPATLKDVTIKCGTKIRSSAFYNCDNLTSLTILDGVTSIGSSAFYSCESLTSITIPDSVTSIGSGAFYYCTSLESITIPDSVTSIYGDTFCNCTSLTSITIPASVTSIGLYAFEHCTSLKEVHIADIEAWLNISFAKYTSNPLNYGGNLYLNDELLTNLIIPDSVTSIGDYAFLKCASLISVTIPDSVTSIGSSTFYGCSSLEEITLPFVGNTKEGASNTHFGYIFGASSHSYNNDYVPTSLKKVTITGGTKISSSAFYSCNGLLSITAPDSVTSIGDYAFSGCTSLTNINVPARAMSIGNYAFSDCTSLASIIIPNSVTSIGYVAFSGCTSLVSIIIPYGVTNIDSSTFSNCTSLTSITLPNSVTNIAYGAFRGCSSLTSITIPNSVISIGYEVFSGCTSLISICVPNSVTSIGSSAFKNCSNLTSITISDSLTSIGYEVFSRCTSLKSIMIPDSVTSINYDAFSGCTSLTCVTVPDSVTSIGSSAFYGCANLEEIILPFVGNAKYGTSNTHFGYIFGASSYSFNDDYVPRSLKKVTITGGTSVCPYDFYNCTSLTSITILDRVTSIDYCAFKSCSSLTSIAIPNSVKSIDSNVFVDCMSLKDVYFDGTRAEWEEINISYGNSYLLNATLHFATVNVDSVALDITSRAMFVGNSFALTATVLPEYADNKTISWESSNASVASVDNGVVTAVSSGTATITVLTEDGNKTATCIVSVQIPTVSVADVSLNKSELDLQLGNSETLIATVLPTNATNKNVTWSSSNSNVVSVSSNGVVTAKAVGTAVIIVATADGGKIDSCLVNVSPATVPVTSLSLNKTSATMYVGAVETLITTVTPSNATNKTISWFSSNPSVATVSDGIVTAKTAGTTTITVETVDSLYTATCVVTVKEVYASFKINDITVRPSEKFYVDLVVENSVPIKAMTINGIEYSDTLTLTDAEWLLPDSTLNQVDISGDSLIAFSNAVEANKAVMRLYFKVDDNLPDQEAYISFNAMGTDEENVTFNFVSCEGTVNVRNFVVGDCDGDEAITIDDAIHLAFYTFYPDRYQIPNGMNVDFNKDGEVTIDDAIYLAFYTFYPERYPIN